jgi:uncharacterized protein YyaL (SSP411 family)
MLTLYGIITLSKHYASFMSLDLARLYLPMRREEGHNLIAHLNAGIDWICRAQDAYPDGGVARSYSILYNPYFKRKGWIPSYPETTGYIIPTMFDYARLTGRQDIFDRAVRMADWECDVQMQNGAVQGGAIDQPPIPAIFNTGQVIFGWVRAFQETRNERYLGSAQEAGRYLVSQQDQNGAWNKNLSQYAGAQMSFFTYNTRTAWALLELSMITGDPVFRDSAIRNIEFALTQQLENGWFESNCLSDPSQPLLHTIAYCVRGILESGILLNDTVYIEKAKKAADALLRKQQDDGNLTGRFNDRWESTVKWTCLTGNAQIALIWGRLFQKTGQLEYLNGLNRSNRYLMNVQLRKTGNPGLDGGIAGSYPLHGPYGQFEVLNWAVKFFADALMLEMSIEAASHQGASIANDQNRLIDR